MAAVSNSTTFVPIKDIIYCEVCTYPPEYCEFSGTLSRCKEWLRETHSDMYQTLYANESSENPESVAPSKSTITKAEKKIEAEAEKKKKTKVLIKTEKRKGKKSVTIITNLDVFSIDLKKASKMLAQKFATGCSISKNAEGKDELVVQGDIVEDVIDFLLTSFPSITQEKIQTQ